jgi:triphosphatase
VTTSDEAGDSLEVELKFRVLDPAAGDRYLEADDIGGFRPASAVHATRIEDRYLDTATSALAGAGFAARLREAEGRTIVAVKSAVRRVGDGNVHRREELEGPADRASNPRDWPPSDARTRLLELSGEAPLVELVTLRQLRRKRLLERDGTAVELSVDDVEAVAGHRVVGTFTELEVELVHGDENGLADIDRALAADPDLAAADSSKLTRALAAVAAAPKKRARRDRGTDAQAGAAAHSGQGQNAEPGVASRPHLEVAKSPGVLADDHIAEAGRKVLRFHLARMIAREAGTRAGRDPTDLHGMRVATRRQRAAWRIFGEAFRPGRTRAYRRRLRDVASRLGAVRDLDVLLEAAEAYRADLPVDEQQGLEPLLSAWRTHRDDARILLLRELDSEGYRRWLDDYAEFVRHEGTAVQASGSTIPHRVRDTAASRIQGAFERVRAFEPVLRWADVETLHELRIAAKWLRYSMEFVREALGPEVDPLIARVTALQDQLGQMHDSDVAARLARDFLVDHADAVTSAEAAAIGRYLIRCERERDRLVRSIGPRWRGVAGLAFRRRLGRTLAGL